MRIIYQPKSLEALTSVIALCSAVDMKSPKIGRYRRAKSAVYKHGHPCYIKRHTRVGTLIVATIYLQLIQN